MNTELVEPILRGIAHPHTALTEEELAQVRADLELAEPKKCTTRFIDRLMGTVTEECGQPAVQESMYVCGYVCWTCAEHVRDPYANSSNLTVSYMQCRKCGYVGSIDEHTIAVVPL